VAFWKAAELLYRFGVQSASLDDFLVIDPVPVNKGVRKLSTSSSPATQPIFKAEVNF